VSKSSHRSLVFAAIALAGLVSCVSPQAGTPLPPDAADDVDAATQEDVGRGPNGATERDGAADLPAASPDLAAADAPASAITDAGGAPPDVPAPPADANGPQADVAAPADVRAADTAAPLLAVGRSCTNAGQCQSNACVDGVCCATACTGSCQSCASASTGLADGTCGPTRDGTDPHDDCAKSTQTCGIDGACDGKGQCRFAGAEVTCGAESCSNAMYTPPAHCDGKGACPTPTAISCGAYPCQGPRCATSCSASLPCPSSSLYCDGSGKCQAKKTAGAGCNGGEECATGYCTEGVCCDGACNNTCRSCLGAHTGTRDGQCAPIKNGIDPYNQCTAQPASTCQNDGLCNGLGGCRQHVLGTPCRSASCSDGAGGSTSSPPGVCNGGGLCQDQGSGANCGAYVCGADQCKMTCASTSECVGATYCDSQSHCVPCPQPSASNMLANPGFNQNLGSWTLDIDPGADARRNTLDRDTCRGSGSMELRVGGVVSVTAKQCFAAGAGSYNFGGAFLASAVSEAVMSGAVPWLGICSIRFYASMADCQGNTNQLDSKSIYISNQATVAGQWINFGMAWFASAGTNAAMYECFVLDDGAPSGTYVLLDKLYVSMSGGTF
jgi:hypothetical protein